MCCSSEPIWCRAGSGSMPRGSDHRFVPDDSSAYSYAFPGQVGLPQLWQFDRCCPNMSRRSEFGTTYRRCVRRAFLVDVGSTWHVEMAVSGLSSRTDNFLLERSPDFSIIFRLRMNHLGDVEGLNGRVNFCDSRVAGRGRGRYEARGRRFRCLVGASGSRRGLCFRFGHRCVRQWNRAGGDRGFRSGCRGH